MQFKDQALWDSLVETNKDDGYSMYILKWAETWANLMEAEMANGAKLEDIAMRTSHESDTEGGTGFQYGMVVKVLAQCWEHGEILRIWHNKPYGYGPEDDGVVNPAILTIKG